VRKFSDVVGGGGGVSGWVVGLPTGGKPPPERAVVLRTLFWRPFLIRKRKQSTLQGSKTPSL